MSRRALWLAPLALVAFACSDSGNVVTIHTEVPGENLEDAAAGQDSDAATMQIEASREHLEDADADEDGVATRDDVERAKRAAQRAEQEAAARAVFEDRSAVAAGFPGGQLSVAQVRDSLAGSPSSLMDDPENPTHEEFVSRLTSMLQLRLAAVALAEFGFAVDIDASDEDINAQVQEHLEGPFEEFAQQRSIDEDPSIERLATPHCVSALVLTNEADAVAAAERVRGGEAMADVAADVNLPGLTETDGAIGCGQPFELFGAGEVALALLEIDVGEVTEPILLPSAQSPTGELWVAMHLDELQSDLTDLSAIGPFAGRVLTEVMAGYEVNVAPELGVWEPSNLRVSMPYLP